MLDQIFDSLLVAAFNSMRHSTEKPPPAPAKPPALPDGDVVLGQVIADPNQFQNAHGKPKLRQPGVATLSPSARKRHLYVLGATGTGKTNLLMQLIASDIAHRRAFCVIDLRGDLIDRILLRLADEARATSQEDEWAKRLLLIDLRDEKHVVGFNPLAGDGDPFSRAMHVLSVLRAQSDSWGVQLEETLRNCLIALAQSGWSLLELEPLLSNTAFRSQVLDQVRDDHVRGFFERYEALSSAQKTTWTLACLNKITPLLAIPQLRLMFGQRQAISFRTLMDEQPGMVVLISLAVDRLHDAARLVGGLFVSSFQTSIMSRADVPEKQRVPTHFYVDEFETMASDRFESIVAEGRRFGLGLCLSLQNLSQLSPGLRNVLRNNVHTQLYFQTGALDAADLAREITGDASQEQVRATIIGQRMGEAYLVRRGQASCRIKTQAYPDPKIAVEATQPLQAASLATYARPTAEIERQLTERLALIKGLKAQQPGGYSTRNPVTQNPVYEIRHGKPTSTQPSVAGTSNEEPDAL